MSQAQPADYQSDGGTVPQPSGPASKGLKGSLCIHLLVVAAGLVVVLNCTFAQTFGDEQATWPTVTPSVTSENGWVVLVGRVDGFPNRVAWRVWLAPEDGAVRMEPGSATTYVTIGSREFVVENATGDTHEMRGGRLWRRISPGEPAPEPEPSIIPRTEDDSYQQSYREYSTGFAPPQRSGGYLLLPPPDPPSLEGASVDDPQSQQIRRYTRLLEDQLDAYEGLIAANSRLHRLRQQGDASAPRLRMAQQEVSQAVARIEAIQAQIEQQSPDLYALAQAPPSMPRTQDALPFATEEQLGQISELRQRTLTLNTRLRDQRQAIQQMRLNSAPRHEIIQATEQLELVERELDDTQAQLDFAQIVASAPAGKYVDPDLRQRMGRSEREVLALIEQRQQARRGVRWAQIMSDEGRISGLQRQDIVDRLQTVERQLASAKRELGDLQQIAIARYNATGGATAGKPTDEQPHHPPSQDEQQSTQ